MNVIDPLERARQRLHGQLCWGMHWSQQLNLSMSIGDPTMEVGREPYESKSRVAEVRRSARRRRVRIRGRWWLWVYVAYWRIRREGALLAAGSSSLRDIQAALLDLEGQKLMDVRVNPGTGVTGFVFDLETVLEVRRRRRRSTDELWLLYEPGGYVLSVRGDGTYDHGPGSGVDKRPGVERRPVPSASTMP